MNTNEKMVQTSPAEMPFQNVFGQMVEQFISNNQTSEEFVSLLDVEQQLETIFPLLLGKTEEELIELLGTEITQLISPLLEQLKQIIEENEIDVESTEQLINYLSMLLFTPDHSNMPLQQNEMGQTTSRETVTTFYRFLQIVESALTQQMTQKNNQIKSEQALNEQSFQLQKYETVVSKIVEQLKTNLQNYQSASTKQSVTDETGNQAKSAHFQQLIPFQQTAMDRIQQLEWRIQLVDESDSATFVKEFEKILMSSNLRTFKNGLTELQVRLYPEHLGRLSIKLIQQDGTLIAKITAQSDAAKKLIESQLHQLRHALIAQNIQVEKIEITTSANVQQEQEQSEAQERDKHEREPSQFNREDEQRDDEEQSFKEWLESLIF